MRFEKFLVMLPAADSAFIEGKAVCSFQFHPLSSSLLYPCPSVVNSGF
jgi:hypothetical protein